MWGTSNPSPPSAPRGQFRAGWRRAWGIGWVDRFALVSASTDSTPAGLFAAAARAVAASRLAHACHQAVVDLVHAGPVRFADLSARVDGPFHDPTWSSTTRRGRPLRRAARRGHRRLRRLDRSAPGLTPPEGPGTRAACQAPHVVSRRSGHGACSTRRTRQAREAGSGPSRPSGRRSSLQARPGTGGLGAVLPTRSRAQRGSSPPRCLWRRQRLPSAPGRTGSDHPGRSRRRPCRPGCCQA